MTHQTTVNSLTLGALGGVIASIAMYPFLYLTTSMMGIPLDDLCIARGMALSNNNNNYLNLFLGIGMHVFTGAISGMIFIVIITIIKKFRINSFKKGNYRRSHLLINHIHSFIYSNYDGHSSTKSLR